jgi:hypothetical protein
MRRTLLVMSIVATAAAWLAPPASAQSVKPLPAFDAGGVTGLDLETQLQKGLKARRPVEFQYIHEINELVEKGELPRKLVVTTFLAAQQRRRHPLQWFQLALESRARGLDVTLPNLDLQAVGISTNGGTHGVNTPPIPPR